MTEKEAMDKFCPLSLRDGKFIKCIGSKCMAWRWLIKPIIGPGSPAQEGFCGIGSFENVEIKKAAK